MSSHVALRFALSGGSRHGMGHVMRCAVLAEAALARGLRVDIALDGDARAADALQRELPSVRIAAWSSPDALARGAERLVFDTRIPIQAELEAAARAGAPRIVLDRLDALDTADLTIVPALHAPTLPHPRFRGGAEYCVLAPVFRSQPPPRYPGRRDVTLVTLGGADPHELTERVGESLAALLCSGTRPEKVPEIHCVIGPAFRDAASLQQRLQARGVVTQPACTRTEMRALMERSLFAVAGFGITTQELAIMGVPTLHLTHHRSDLEAAARLEQQGLGAVAAFGGDFDARAFDQALGATLLDVEWRQRVSRRGRALLGDGGGAARILDAALALERRGAPA